MSQERDTPEDRGGADEDGGQADLMPLRELCRLAAAPEPDEAAWNDVLMRVRDGVGADRRRAPRVWWAVIGAGAAAAVLAVMLTHSWRPDAALPPAVVEQPYPVAGADDVTILSMDARDVAALVVGEPPIVGEFEFARLEDVHVLRCERCPHSGNVAHLEPGEVPMVVATVARAGGGEE